MGQAPVGGLRPITIWGFRAPDETRQGTPGDEASAQRLLIQGGLSTYYVPGMGTEQKAASLQTSCLMEENRQQTNEDEQWVQSL